MFKWLLITAALLAGVYFGLGYFGYQIHPDNLSYYLPSQTPEASGKGGAFSSFMENIKRQSQYHPLITKKRTPPKISAASKPASGTLDDLVPTHQFAQMEKLKKDIKAIQKKTSSRKQQLEELAKNAD